MKPRIVKSVPVGEELAPLSKAIMQRQMDCYSGVRQHSLHTDAEWAKKRGFKAPIAQALMLTAYVSELMVRHFGIGYIVGGKMSVSFTKPVYAGDTLTVRGRVKSRQPEGTAMRVTVDVWCENAEGVMTLVGTASGLEPGSS